MAKDVVLPQWGMNMQDGTLTKWLKREGDSVQQGEPLVEVETAKINSALEAPTAGIVAHILIPEGQTVAIGTVVAIIAAPGEQVARPASIEQLQKYFSVARRLIDYMEYHVIGNDSVLRRLKVA